MESIIKDNMIAFLEENNVITTYQHGFVNGISCLTNLLESFKQQTKALDNGYSVDIMYLDYKNKYECTTDPEGCAQQL